MFSKIFLLVFVASQFLAPSVVQEKNGQILGVETSQAEERVLPLVKEVAPEITKLDFSEKTPDILAGSAVVIDSKSRFVFYEKNIDEQRSIASITKLMSFLVLDDFGLDLEQKVVVKQEDYHGGMHYLRVGEEVQISDLIHLALIGSDNTAVSTLVRSTGLTDTEFVNLMNQKAYFLGLKNSSFADPTGLKAKNLSTARDVVKIFKEINKRENLSEILGLRGAKVVTSDRTFWIKNTNILITNTNLNIKAGKTGFTDEAGGCLVFLSKSGGRDVFFVVLGSQNKESRFTDAESLWAWVSENFEWE
jgi:serine-type D-Ala-D-Ala endopeptidase (penicillin-binding protein 7)